jgi:predicted nucleic acid-binding protein
MSAIVDGDQGIAAVFATADRMWVPVIALGEYRYGLMQSSRRTEYESWIERRSTTSGLPRFVGRHGYDLLSRDSHFDEVAGAAPPSW